MKHIITFIATLMAVLTPCLAQPSGVKEAANSVFKLTTYKADGTVLAESNGVFTSADGTAVSSLKPFLGAARAVVTDAKGRQAEVTRMLGANELYNVAKFKVNGIKAKPLALASTPAKGGEAVWPVTYGGKGGQQPVAATVKSVETFMEKYSYYIFAMQAPDGSTSCPFVNAAGEMIGILKPSTASTDIHATDARFANSLTTTGFALNDPALRQIGIAPALPQDLQQARFMLIMAEQEGDSVKRPAIISDFLEQYPTVVDGYSAMARLQAGGNDYEGASKTMEAAIKQAEQKDEAHAGYGKLIYDNLMFNPALSYKQWTLDKAAEETDKAYAINPQPTYQHQQAQITFAKGNYQQAYDAFTQLVKTSLHNPELFYEAAQCKIMMKAPQQEIIALLDSAINNTDTLRMREAAPYFLARAEAYNAVDSFRQAVFDYARYEILAGRQLGAQFYYVRGQTEIKAKLYQQALRDIATAIVLAPEEPTYYAEMASLQLRVNLTDDAIMTANKCIELAPEYSDGYLILGLAQIGKDDMTTGLANLEKAKQLGNAQAQSFIDKYTKQQ